MLSLQQFRVLVAVHDTGSLSQAAAQMGYGTPTVTHHLNLLESHFESVLVQRGSRGVTFTPLGLEVLREAEHILHRVDTLERKIAQHRDAGLITLRIGTFASLGSRLLPPAIHQLQKSSNVRIEVIEAEPLELVSLLHNGELDAALLYDLAEDPALTTMDLSLVELLKEPYLIAVSEDDPLAKNKTLNISELAGKSWVQNRHRGEAIERLLSRASRNAGFIPTEFIRTDDMAMIHGLVSEGLCLAVMPQSALIPSSGVTLIPTKQQLGTRSVYFATPNDVIPPAVNELLSSLKNFSRQLMMK